MSKREFNVGLAGYGLYLPRGVETAAQVAARSGLSEEKVRDLGIEGKLQPGPEDQPVVMAVKAARTALEQTPGVSPEEVDLVLWIGEEYKDYIAQTASIRLQEEAGCKKAWAFDLVGQGTTSLVGLRVARDMMVGDDAINTVLLAGGTRNVDLVDYANPRTRFLLAASASGGALILRRDLGRNLLKEILVRVDSKMADEVYVPGGGTEHPFAPDNLDSPEMFYQVQDPPLLEEYLKEAFPQGLIRTTQQVCGEAAPDYLALRHLAPAMRERVLAGLNLKEEQSSSLDKIGHHGTNDVIISLDAGLRSGAVREGKTVCLASAGIGFTYAAAVLEWGPAGG